MLNEQLQQQIEQEATSSAANFHYYPGSEQFEDMESAYEAGAFKYAEKWQEEKERADRYEKALNWVKQYALNCQNNRTIPNPLVIYSTIDKALAHKTTTDDTVNG